MALNFFLFIIFHLFRVGLDAEFHDHGHVSAFSQARSGLRHFDGLVFHGGICGVTVFGRPPGVGLQRSWDTVTVPRSTAAIHG